MKREFVHRAGSGDTSIGRQLPMTMLETIGAKRNSRGMPDGGRVANNQFWMVSSTASIPIYNIKANRRASRIGGRWRSGPTLPTTIEGSDCAACSEQLPAYVGTDLPDHPGGFD